MINTEHVGRLTRELKGVLPAGHPAIKAVLDSCEFWRNLPADLIAIDSSANAELKTLKALEKHLKYAVNAAKQLPPVEGSIDVVAALERAQSFAANNRARLTIKGGRPKKRGQAHLANGISCALSAFEIPAREHGNIIRKCFLALDFPLSEAESAIKFISNLKRKKLPSK